MNYFKELKRQFILAFKELIIYYHPDNVAKRIDNWVAKNK